jgi:predicted transcriptional regulator
MSHIQTNPGLHFRELCRQLNVGVGLLDHHVRVLQKLSLIMTYKNGNHKCFFTNTVSEVDMCYITFLRSKTTRIMLLNLINSPSGLTHCQIRRITKLAPSTITWHIQKLKASRIIAQKGQYLKLSDPVTAKNVLNKYKETLFDSMASKFMDMWV